MNFAYGGTGVFDTDVDAPNMTTQIDFFENLVKNGQYSQSDLDASVADVSVVGNDYAHYLSQNGTQGLPDFVASVVNQLGSNLKRIHDLGVRKVVVAALPPVGCLPASTILSSYQSCINVVNVIVSSHNPLLQDVVRKLNNGATDSPFGILDFNNAFLSAINGTGSYKFTNPLKPCCLGVDGGKCGSVDEHGGKKYTVCEDPKTTFFWDSTHPTQQGWIAVYSAVLSSLDQILK